MKEVPVHEVPTHIATEDVIAGKPIGHWLTLSGGFIIGYILYTLSKLILPGIWPFVLAFLAVIPFVLFFFFYKSDEAAHVRFYYWFHALVAPRYYLWHRSGARQDALLDELLGDDENGTAKVMPVNAISGWIDIEDEDILPDTL